jgi:putative lipoprotein
MSLLRAALPSLALVAMLAGCAQQDPNQVVAGFLAGADIGGYGRLPRAGVPAQPPEAPSVHGTLVYRERIALPPNAVAEIDLVEGGKSGHVVATTRVPVTGQIPIAFALTPAESALAPHRIYALRARLLVDGKVMFQTEGKRPVAVSASSGPVELLLVAAQR